MAELRDRIRLSLTLSTVAAMRRAYDEGKREVLRNLAGHRRTGAMERSVHFRVRPGARSVTGTLSVTNEGASFLDGGTRGPIRPRRARALAVGKREGADISYRREVRGQSATHFFTKVAETMPERIAKELAKFSL